MDFKHTLLLISLSVLFYSVSTIAKPQRVISLNLCADQLLMELLKPSSLVGITQLASDPSASFSYRKAHDFHQHNGRIEEVMALKPDLVIAGAFTSTATNQMLGKLGYKIIKLGLPKTVEEIIQQITFLGEQVGEQQRANELIEAVRDEITILGSRNRAATGLRAVVYYANGFSAGKETIVNEILRLAGLKNIAADMGMAYIAPLSLESLLVSNPDVLLLGRLDANTDSLAHQVLQHDAIEKLSALEHVQKISVPDRYWSCAGPSSIAAASYIQQKITH
jgi:iron complex transport system substrate-binding protein